MATKKVLKKIIKNNVEYELGGGIESSNSTYDNIIHLSQSDYDNLQTKDPNTLYSTPEDESGGFEPENEGEEGQVLTKTSTGYAYETIETGASDHLETKVAVGELYNTNNNLVIQDTPTYVNSTVEQKVGDTANNTQIHIQRIASGTGSNELKLKLKKVGTPGDLSVQVMSGIQVTVTANAEAYWYGDSNNVLATGSVSASSITTGRQEITVTLNNQVGGTEGELLDIVLSIPTVNASNYVVIGCDSSQYGEGFSFVAVNGSTRTRSKFMPYCISDGFKSKLLIKSQTAYIDIDGYSTVALSPLNGEASGTKEITSKTSKIFRVHRYSNTGSSSTSITATLYNGSTIVGSQKNSSGSKTDAEVSWTFDSRTTVNKVVYSSSGNTPIYYISLLYGNSISPKQGNAKVRGSGIVEIGGIASVTIFGYHTDGTWVNHS